jgi:hypothetical protein
MKTATTLIDVAKAFATPESCLTYLEAARWPEGVRCLKCGGDKVSKFVTKDSFRNRRNRKTKQLEIVKVPARHLYECLKPECRHQFSATTGTIFHDTHLPIEKWFMAVALMVNAKKGLSAMQMQRDLGVTYRTAWYLCHRIRKSMEEGNPGLLAGTVEADETFVGGRYDRRRNRGPRGQQPVFGALQRATAESCSKIRAFPISNASTPVITGAVRGTISVKADLFITDQYKPYTIVGREYRRHEAVNHIKLEYVRRGEPSIHTNSIEGFWSLFKRGLIGSFHKVSVKHLRRYLDEFSFRFNNRDCEDLFALVVVNLLIASGIRYAELTAKPVPEEPEPPAYDGPRSSYEPW